MSRLIKDFFFAGSVLLGLSLIAGCTGHNSEKAYIPKTAHAKEALEVVLKEWQSGAAFGRVEGFTVPIDVFDSRWQSGKKLESYEILREETTDGPKTFVVKMKLVDDKEETEIKYLVLGIDPLNVFTEHDYKKATGGGG